MLLQFRKHLSQCLTAASVCCLVALPAAAQNTTTDNMTAVDAANGTGNMAGDMNAMNATDANMMGNNMSDGNMTGNNMSNGM